MIVACLVHDARPCSQAPGRTTAAAYNSMIDHTVRLRLVRQLRHIQSGRHIIAFMH
jgi:hypothetical protein